jgi:hypothetical protein
MLPCDSLSDLALDIADLGRESLRPSQVSFIRSGLGTLMPGRDDLVGGFEFDQLLHHETHNITDQTDPITSVRNATRSSAGQTHLGPHRWTYRHPTTPQPWLSCQLSGLKDRPASDASSSVIDSGQGGWISLGRDTLPRHRMT